jgi:hypothetical protein
MLKRKACSFVPKPIPVEGAAPAALASDSTTVATSGQSKAKASPTKKRATKTRAGGGTNAVAGPSNVAAFVGNPPPRVINVGMERMHAFGDEAAGAVDSEWVDARIAAVRRDILITADQIAIQMDIKAAFERRLTSLLEMKKKA